MKIFQHRAKVSHKQRDLAVLKYLPPPFKNGRYFGLRSVLFLLFQGV